MSGAPVPAASQTPAANLLQFECSFVNSPNDCGFYEQAKALPRASIVNAVARIGTTSVRLHTEPGDNYVYGSNAAERDDLSLSQAATGCYSGQEQWWAHSVLFPDDYLDPPESTASTWNWGVVFNFHQTEGWGPVTFEVMAMPSTAITPDRPTGLVMRGAGGDPNNPTTYSAPIGPVVKNVWYDFVYHVKWSSGSDGFFYAWVNGAQKLAYNGPTLFVNQGCYLKLSNYHSAFGKASSVIHDRVLRGTSAAAVSPPPVSPPPVSPPPVSPPPNNKRRAASDFDGDGKSDILWRNGLTGENQIWFMSGTALSSASPIYSVVDPNWKIAGSGDFDGDGKSDILWRNSATGQNALWLMNGATLVSGPFLPTKDLNWSIAGVGDFNGDGKSDILWRNGLTGENQIWFVSGATLSSAASIVSVTDPNWKIEQTADFDGDGKSDILWRNSATGQNAIWLMNGATLLSGPFLPTNDLNWSIAGVGDFNGDGKSDILWRHGVTGQNAIWLMNGATLVSGPFLPTMTDLKWGIAGVGDFDGDGRSDILWHDEATGQNLVWFMKGATLTGLTFLDTAPLAWSVPPR
jgi:hypothetical protein